MKRIKQPNNWSCLLTSFSMVFDLHIEQLITELGHDGSEIFWPDLPEPLCRRSFHIQEFILLGYKFGWLVTPFEFRPVLGVFPGFKTHEINIGGEEKIFEIMKGKVGVLTSNKHAVAWNGIEVLDPDEGQISIPINTFWMCTNVSLWQKDSRCENLDSNQRGGG